jgi:beta-N-acetylglucosaminidase
MLAWAVTTPLLGYLPDHGNGVTVSEAYYQKDSEKTKPSKYVAVDESKIKIAMASTDLSMQKTYGITETKEINIPKNGFVAVREDRMPVSTNTTLNSYDALIELPEKYHDNFHIEISGNYAGSAVKLFTEPNDTHAVSGKYYLPTKFTIKDLTLYNGKYFRVTDDIGHQYFIDSNQSDWDLIGSVDNLHVVGKGDFTVIEERTRRNTLDITERTNLTREDIANIIAGTGLEGCEDAIIEIEEEHSINSLFTIALAGVESGYGSSWLADERNNLFGICAYDSNTDAATYFPTKSDCIRYWGRLIAEEYFDEGCLTLEAINEYYASNPEWASDVRSLMQSMLNEV